MKTIRARDLVGRRILSVVERETVHEDSSRSGYVFVILEDGTAFALDYIESIDEQIELLDAEQLGDCETVYYAYGVAPSRFDGRVIERVLADDELGATMGVVAGGDVLFCDSRSPEWFGAVVEPLSGQRSSEVK